MNSAPHWKWLAGTLCSLSLLSACTGLFQSDLPLDIAQYQRQGRGELRVGAAEVDITPVDDQYLAGFSLARTATGLHLPLKARAMVIQVGDLRCAIVGLDNLGLQRQDADWIKAGIPGFANGNVLLCCSHTHAAPDLIGLWGFYLWTSGRDPAYLRQVREAVALAVAQAAAAARPARFRQGQVRLPATGFMGNRRTDGLFNRRLTVLQALEQGTDQPLGCLLHLACHPEMMRRANTLVSADFVGAWCDAWRDAGMGQAVFVNGELGALITPAYHTKGVAGTPLLAEELVQFGQQALTEGADLPVAEAEVRRSDVYLPLTSPALRVGLLTQAVSRPLYQTCLHSSVGYLRLGSLEAICVPGEMEPAMAARIRHATRRPNLLVFGLVDDEVGYLLREDDARDPNYQYERLVSPGVLAGEVVYRALVPLQ